MDKLAEVRRKWEEGLTPLVVLPQPREESVLVVLQEKESRNQYEGALGDPYHCHRYFAIGEKWECSVDGQGVSLDTVWSWLNDPCAASTREIKLPEEAGAVPKS